MVRVWKPLLCFLVLAGTCLRVSAQTNPFEWRVRLFEAADLRNPPPPNSIVFVGSSTIDLWTSLADSFPDFDVLNRGISGTQTSDALYFADRLAIHYRPPLLVFYEGDNDLAAGKSLDQIFNDTTNFFARVQAKSPNTHILYVSVKPSPSRAGLMPLARELNQRVRSFLESRPRLHFANVFDAMLDASGQPRTELFQADNLHMNAAGYALWTSILEPIFEQFAARYPIPIERPLQGTATSEIPPGLLAQITIHDDALALTLNGVAGLIYTVQESADLSRWTDIQQIEATADSQTITLPTTGDNHFYRLLQ